MRNLIDEDKDYIGKVIKNTNRAIIIFELIGISILGWLIYIFATGN